MIGSRAFRALMRRDLVYRKRNLIGSVRSLAFVVSQTSGSAFTCTHTYIIMT